VTVEVLIECGADPNAEDKHGRTPAHVAVAKGADGILRRLVTAGGDGAST
jgi:ankyrin repeat protein